MKYAVELKISHTAPIAGATVQIVDHLYITELESSDGRIEADSKMIEQYVGVITRQLTKPLSIQYEKIKRQKVELDGAKDD